MCIISKVIIFTKVWTLGRNVARITTFGSMPMVWCIASDMTRIISLLICLTRIYIMWSKAEFLLRNMKTINNDDIW